MSKCSIIIKFLMLKNSVLVKFMRWIIQNAENSLITVLTWLHQHIYAFGKDQFFQVPIHTLLNIITLSVETIIYVIDWTNMRCMTCSYISYCKSWLNLLWVISSFNIIFVSMHRINNLYNTFLKLYLLFSTIRFIPEPK